jgi:hypothetical protein
MMGGGGKCMGEYLARNRYEDRNVTGDSFPLCKYFNLFTRIKHSYTKDVHCNFNEGNVFEMDGTSAEVRAQCL